MDSEPHEELPRVHMHNDNEPYVKVLNMPKDKKDSAFARTREALVAKSAYDKLNYDKERNEEFESKMNSAEHTQKKEAMSLYDADFSNPLKEQLSNTVIFEAVESLNNEKQLLLELAERK